MDANGNLVARGSDSFGYDQANRLKSANVSGMSSTYVYDGDGKRTSKTVASTQTSFVYNVNASLPVLLDDGTHKYVWGIGLAFAVDQAGNPLVYHTDGLGSVRALADASGSVVQTYQYDEYGNVVSSSGSITQPFGYTGEQRDAETGLTYLRARYYEPYLNRFIQSDPIVANMHNPLALNRYIYALDNPLGYVDPSGLSSSQALNGDAALDSAWAANTGGTGLVGFGGGLLYSLAYENMPTRSGQARLGRPNSSMRYAWERSFHLDAPHGSTNYYHLNADFGPLHLLDRGPRHPAVPVSIYRLGSTSALRAVGRAAVVVGVAIDAYDIATAEPSDRGRAIAGVAGGWGGAIAGAAVGSAIVPGVGTVIGGLVGGAVGSVGGQVLGNW